ncbi:leucine-rich repeat domain-containing protein [Microcoleus sp. FACHB-53]|nr:leucine-rich repeat domain-containing protein [Microcoleus sp. FACHB-53]
MTEAELLRVIEQAASEGVTELDLSGNDLTTLPPAIGRLTQLKKLILGKYQYNDEGYIVGSIGNKLSALPAEIGQLNQLEELQVVNNRLSALPGEIVQLTSLQSLYLSGNQLSALPGEIVQLTSLQTLYLSGNQLSALPGEIGQLTSLQSLYLGSNQLSVLPEEIVQLTSLQTLYLGSNQLSALPPEIGQLTSLQSLDLRYNQLSALPGEIVQLTSLQSLYLHRNQLSALLPEIGQLTSLQTLDLNSNQLSALPREIGQLTSLQTLWLFKNHLSALPGEIGQLTLLQTLDLEGNQLSALPPQIKQLPNLERLDLRGNPVPIPPEILGPKELMERPGDVKEILDFYFQVQDPAETEPLYEAKFLIVGEGGAGKTSLAKKIETETYELQSDEESTQGIDVIRWDFPLPDGQNFRVNIWDFGGQEIYHQTHQFFLTERSLYVLVVDTRQENTDFYWWLKVVELLSGNSPIVIVKNEKQDRQCQVNERQLRGEFTNLKEVLATNLATNRGLPEIKDAIQQYISRLPHVGSSLPKLWVRVRSALENDSRNYITVQEYRQLCRLNQLTDRQDMLMLSRYLHDLGVCLHFQDDSTLKHWVILKPEWGTAAVYQVLDNETVKKNLGCFTQDDLKDIWQDIEYAEMLDELLKLMMQFKLCYAIPNRPDTYIAPQLLDFNQPSYTWYDTNSLILRYNYEFMPKGILTRFIVETHPWIEQQKLVWRSGVILNKDQTRAEVIEQYNQKEIKIRVTGIRKKELLAVITHELEKIHNSYERLKYQTFVPCNCEDCQGSQTPHSYPLDRLRKRLDAGKYKIECENSYEMVDVRRLIDDVNLQPLGVEREINPRDLPLQRELQQERAESMNRSSEPKFDQEIFISYAWGGENEEYVNNLDRTLQEKGITIIRDKRDLGYKGLIKDFMERIGRGKCVIAVISDKYLKSPNCMFELVQVAKNGEIRDRIFPIVLADAQIYKPVARIKYIQHWENEIKELDEAMRGVGAANLQGFREEIDQYTEIRNTIAELTNLLKDMNTLTPDIHSQLEFQDLIKAIEDRLDQDTIA